MAKWPEYRLKQLDDLEELLKECEAIDNANNTIARLQRIIALAKSMNHSDREHRQLSFMHFLEDEAIGRSPQPASDK